MELKQTPAATAALDRTPEPARAVLRNPYAWAFFAGVIVLTLLRPALRHEPAPPPVLGQLPEFRLTAAGGQPFGSAELSGQVYVASFFFTRCVSVCPLLTAAMGHLQERYEQAGVDGVRLVSVSVDPEHDTPERLVAYGEQHGIDPDRWTLLTGEPDEIRRLVVQGFRAPLGEPEVVDGILDIAHTGKLVLVDDRGAIRGYYDSDATGLDEVFHRSRHVLGESRP